MRNYSIFWGMCLLSLALSVSTDKFARCQGNKSQLELNHVTYACCKTPNVPVSVSAEDLTCKVQDNTPEEVINTLEGCCKSVELSLVMTDA